MIFLTPINAEFLEQMKKYIVRLMMILIAVYKHVQTRLSDRLFITERTLRIVRSWIDFCASFVFSFYAAIWSVYLHYVIQGSYEENIRLRHDLFNHYHAVYIMHTFHIRLLDIFQTEDTSFVWWILWFFSLFFIDKTENIQYITN